jgi:hypothetical protein
MGTSEATTVRVGQIVLYSHTKPGIGGKPQLETSPAIVTRVNSPSHERPTVALAIFSRGLGLQMPYCIPYSDEPRHGSWSLPREGRSIVPWFPDLSEQGECIDASR